MSKPLESRRSVQMLERRIQARGLRPRFAAAVIASLWLTAIALFGIIQHLVDPDSFDTIWDGMWWATQTVTTVGYGDVVPEQTAGKLVGALLMIGGLSFFAVITGIITSLFIARAQADTPQSNFTKVVDRLDEISNRLAAIESRGDSRPPPE
jgi:voltage-gated potassium channel